MINEDGEIDEDEETEPIETLTSEQCARLKFICEQLGGKYRMPVVDDKQRYALPDVTK
jgi:hypothetical protein